MIRLFSLQLQSIDRPAAANDRTRVHRIRGHRSRLLSDAADISIRGRHWQTKRTSDASLLTSVRARNVVASALPLTQPDGLCREDCARADLSNWTEDGRLQRARLSRVDAALAAAAITVD